jgi:hypothetical protein
MNISVNLCNTLTSNGLTCKCKVKNGFAKCGKHLPKNNIPNLININTKIPNKLLLKDIKYTLSYYDIKFNEKSKKNELSVIFKSWVNRLIPYLKYSSEILIIQRLFRLYLVKYTKLLTQTKKCPINIINANEFYTLENIENIPKMYKVYYTESDKWFVFDIRYVFGLIINDNSLNPYSQQPFSQEFIFKCQALYRILKLRHFIPEDKQIKLTLKQKTVKLFLDMDFLDQYTNPAWFFELSKIQLRNFYLEVEDIWNYRLNLTDSFKKEIYPKGKLFIYGQKYLNLIHQKSELREICLDLIDKLINSSKKKCNRINGCLYILMGFAIVNKKAAKSMPNICNSLNIDINNII